MAERRSLKKKKQLAPPRAAHNRSYESHELKTNLRSKGCAEIIGHSVVQEHDLVAALKANSQPAEVKFNARAGIDRSFSVSVDNVPDLIVDDAGRDRTAHAKVDEPALHQPEEAHRAGGLDLGPEQPMQDPQVGAERVGNAAE